VARNFVVRTFYTGFLYPLLISTFYIYLLFCYNFPFIRYSLSLHYPLCFPFRSCTASLLFCTLPNPALSNLTLYCSNLYLTALPLRFLLFLPFPTSPYHLSLHSTLGRHHHSSKRFHRRDLYRPVPPRHHCSNRSGEGRTRPK
jgi:hypothetical protein